MLFYRAALLLSSRALSYVAGVIRRHRRKTGSFWRKLAPGRQALLVLAHLRKGEPPAGLAAGFGVGTATARRYVTETVRLLAARAPGWARRCAPRGRRHRRRLDPDRLVPHRTVRSEAAFAAFSGAAPIGCPPG